MISPVIFNAAKTDYEKTPIILGQPRGLIDSINRQYPEQTKLYEQLRVQDWTEKEFKYHLCKIDFKTADPLIANDMIRNLAWQWKTDSSASSTIAGIMSCVCSSSEIWTGYQRISDNESIHGLTYAEIVRQCFDNPAEALEMFKSDEDAIGRLSIVASVFEEAFVAAHYWALHQARPKEFPLDDRARYDTFDKMFMYIIALLYMERVQFMPSFAKTFGICDLQLFQPIGDAVQRIAQDEIEIHVPFGKANITDLLQTDRGREAFSTNRELIVNLLDEVVQAEDKWVDVMHDDGHELEGAPPSFLKKFNHFGGTDVAAFLGIEKDVKFPLVWNNPLPYMDRRVNLAATQHSPQEAPPTSYLVNVVQQDDQNQTFDFDV